MMAVDSTPPRFAARAWAWWGWRSECGSWGAIFESFPPCVKALGSNFACRYPRHRRQPGWRTSMIRILIADDHGIVRTGLKLLLDRLDDIEVVCEAADGREAVRQDAALRPSIV